MDKHQACLKGVAADCLGLIGGVAIELGIYGGREWASDPDLHNYGRQPDPKVLIAACDRYLDRIAIATATLADILVMRFKVDPQHFALISQVNPMYLIHAYAQVRRVVENGVKVSGATIVCAYRFRGIA